MTDSYSNTSSVSPPPASVTGSAGQKRETLTSRAKRIIGRVLDVDDDPLTSAESSAKGTRSKKSPTRRREQVLQAQRTHRQRTQGYIRELEKEVLRLRDRESALQSENSTLKSTLNENGIMVDFPSSPPSHSHFYEQGSLSPPESLPMSHLTPLTGDNSSAASVTIDLTEMGDIEAETWCSVTSAMGTPRSFEPPTISPAQISGDLLDTMPATLREHSPGDYGAAPALSPQAAIDFVLELERPCLPHVKYTYQKDIQFAPLGGRPAPDFNHGPRHVFTAAASLISSGVAENPMTEPFTMPADGLEKLFQTSLSLNLGDDVTPVQIWANIRRIATKFSLDITVLQMMKNEFMKYVRCNSFGTVIQKDTVSAVFSFFFPGEQFLAVWS